MKEVTRYALGAVAVLVFCITLAVTITALVAPAQATPSQGNEAIGCVSHNGSIYIVYRNGYAYAADIR